MSSQQQGQPGSLQLVDNQSKSSPSEKALTMSLQEERRMRRACDEAALQGRYSLLAVRGKGQFAKVWEARHRLTGEKVAVKILRPDKSGVPMAKVEREIWVMRLLRQQPHIVQLYEAVVSGDGRKVYLVMELAEQGQLFDHVATSDRGRLPEAEARRVFRQVADGVASCHRAMVVHRDLKMENVLLDKDGNVKIADFGFSKPFRYTKVLSRCCGSPEYAAPELHDGRKYVGPEVDVWSCGVILYTMLCGAYPFQSQGDDDDIARMQRNIRGGMLKMPPHLSRDARDLIAGMLNVKPHKRMTMDQVTAHPWLRGDPPPPPPPPPSQQQVQHHLALVASSAALCGVDRNALLHALRHGVENEATVAYHLILRTRSSSLSQQQAPPAPWSWSLPGGVDVGDECPRQTMRHIAAVARDLGILCAFQTPPTTLLCAAASPQDQDHDAVFFEIQLYRPEAHNNTHYVVNLKRISGPQLHYLTICSHLASKLRQIYSYAS